jgi:hypothetical protein
MAARHRQHGKQCNGQTHIQTTEDYRWANLQTNDAVTDRQAMQLETDRQTDDAVRDRQTD